MHNLVVGGTSGLGLELARDLSEQGHEVIVSGRHNPEVDFAEYRKLDLASPSIPMKVASFVAKLPEIKTLVYAPGFYQEGRVTDLSVDQIEAMMNVGSAALVYFMRSILKKQGKLDELITITSSAQWKPQQKEPVYNYAKAAAGHFSNAMSEDGRVEKVLVVGPGGMNTDFWKGVERNDLDTFLDPTWVADEIMKLREDDYVYRCVKIPRDPPQTEIVETR